MMSPVARGLIVGVLFCGWLAYSVMYKQNFDVLMEADDAIESLREIFNNENLFFKLKYLPDINFADFGCFYACSLYDSPSRRC